MLEYIASIILIEAWFSYRNAAFTAVANAGFSNTDLKVNVVRFTDVIVFQRCILITTDPG